MVESSDSGKHKSAPKHSSSLREELEGAADGLSYMSESDYPFQFFTLPAESESDLTPEGFLGRLGVSQLIDEFSVPIDNLIEELSLDDFFPTDEDLAERHGADASDPKVAAECKKYQGLRELLKKRLRGVKVLRVGKVEIRCYIAGLDEQGHIAGLLTTAVET